MGYLFFFVSYGNSSQAYVHSPSFLHFVPMEFQSLKWETLKSCGIFLFSHRANILQGMISHGAWFAYKYVTLNLCRISKNLQSLDYCEHKSNQLQKYALFIVQSARFGVGVVTQWFAIPWLIHPVSLTWFLSNLEHPLVCSLTRGHRSASSVGNKRLGQNRLI